MGNSLGEMMKKLLILAVSVLFIVGCSSEEGPQVIVEEEVKTEESQGE